MQEPQGVTLTLQQQMDSLGPWCHEIEVAEGISTRDWFKRTPREPHVSFLDPKQTVVCKTIPRLFPDGLEGRSVLDCGCNAGGYLFQARELGAGRCFGFDAREHWIKQARFVAHCRDYDDITFEVRDLYEFDEFDEEPFDVTFFNGLLYHLPDPVRGLTIAADLTREVMFVDTAARAGMPDGYLAIENEDAERPMSGIYGLNWLPTGPNVLERMLHWVGFVETRVIDYFEVRADVNRLVMLASKVAGQLAHIPDLRTSRSP